MIPLLLPLTVIVAVRLLVLVFSDTVTLILESLLLWAGDTEHHDSLDVIVHESFDLILKELVPPEALNARVSGLTVRLNAIFGVKYSTIQKASLG